MVEISTFLESEISIEPIENQFINAVINSGMKPPEAILMDGAIHRFKTTENGDKSGWYILFSDGIASGRFGCWKLGIEQTWRANIGRKLTSSEEMANATRLAESKRIRDADLSRKREIGSGEASRIWNECTLAHKDHPYLKRKNIGINGARVSGDGRLVVPLFNSEETLASIQYIDSDGNKLYQSGAPTTGKYWILNPGTDTIFIAEGFATTATILECTNKTCVVAYSASNLVPVAQNIRERFPNIKIIIVADNDKSGVGLKYAEQASAKYGAQLVTIPIEGDANDYVAAGNDLFPLLFPQDDKWLIEADDFSSQPSPIKWLVKNWIQSEALIMIHGPSGGGKTFFVLDLCLRISSNISIWCDNKVSPGSVVYLAGEGHFGLRGRIAAWKTELEVEKTNMWVSADGCDLNTSDGYIRVVDHIRKLSKPPSIIVVDTLHRFLNGDENSAQDAKTMLDACSGLIREFKCSVILVHHTGVADDSQHRARGSSAWRGALDIEISVVPSKNGGPIQIVHRKSKDSALADTIFTKLKSVDIPGWFDEDGQQVSSAVMVKSEQIKTEKMPSNISIYRKIFENCWLATGKEIRDGKPYVSRSSMRDRLEAEGKKPRTVNNDLNPSYSDKLIGALIVARIIFPYEHGWVVCDDNFANLLSISS